MNHIRTAEDLLTSGLTSDDLEEAFDALDLEEQSRYLDIAEAQLPWEAYCL